MFQRLRRFCRRRNDIPPSLHQNLYRYDQIDNTMFVYNIYVDNTLNFNNVFQPVNSLPWYFENESCEEELCSICFENSCDVKCQQCIYMFHKSCVESHKKAREKCPICRYEAI